MKPFYKNIATETYDITMAGETRSMSVKWSPLMLYSNTLENQDNGSGKDTNSSLELPPHYPETPQYEVGEDGQLQGSHHYQPNFQLHLLLCK